MFDKKLFIKIIIFGIIIFSTPKIKIPLKLSHNQKKILFF
jgi:hypothetical protein